MARRKEIVILPHLVDGGGDIEKQWFVEYSCRNPRTGEMKRFREYTGFNKLKSADERRALAERIINDLNGKLAAGWTPFEQPLTEYADELLMQSVAKRWGNARKEVVTIRTHLSSFLAMKKASVSARTMETYRSKMRIFAEWAAMNGMDKVNIGMITSHDIEKFLIDIAKKNKLSRLSVAKYEQILHTFWDYLIKEKVVTDNVVVDIPKIGRVVDMAPRPIPAVERDKMSRLMRELDPQLLIICQLEYYCAIRPGECRLLQVCDVDLKNGQIRVPSNKSKNRMTECVSIPAQLLATFERMHLDQYDGNFYLFGKDGTPGARMVGKNTFRVRFNALRDRAGVSKDYKLYSYKHAAASELVNAGVDTWDLQRHFRHKSIETTQRYLRKKIAKESDLLRNHFPDM